MDSSSLNATRKQIPFRRRGDVGFALVSNDFHWSRKKISWAGAREWCVYLIALRETKHRAAQG
jgi:hypothetical protein